MEERQQDGQMRNPLGTDNIGTLLRRFAVPSVIAMLVGALYNIVDQFFIGQRVGSLGNAATNIAFPLSISSVAIALLLGIGGASCFNLDMGRGEPKRAVSFVGNAITFLILGGVLLCIITELYLEPLLLFFGSPEDVLGYAMEYTRVSAIGFPMLILSTGGGHLIRADGSPRYAMLCNMVGAVLNVFLDWLFVFGLNMGMAGAALATIIGQYIAGGMAIWYFCHYKTVKLSWKHLWPKGAMIGKILSLGAAPCFNQLAMMVVQIVLNNSLKHYGAASIYGASIPLACSGIVMKVCQLFFAFIIGISQGLQPIVSFNYGAKNYARVKKAYLRAIVTGFGIAIVAFGIFQLFPRQILSAFGEGTELYFQFGVRYFRTFMFFTFLNFVQPITSNFFTAIGKPVKGIILSLTRQIIFLLPLLVLLPLWKGIDGILYTGPIADFLAFAVCTFMVAWELKKQ